MELLPFVDILKVFNNPISEEQAWAVCYQCAHFLFRNPTQEFYQDVYDSGLHSIWISRHGDVLLRKGLQEPNGSGKGPPQSPHPKPALERRLSNTNIVQCRTKTGVIATETDAVQALGMAIFEALDYGIDATEERQLSSGLEALIANMTHTDPGLELSNEEFDAGSQNADDEGIEKDADVEHRCGIEDVLRLCGQHLSSKQDSHHHYKAVCRALATEAGELFTFLDKISSGREKLTGTVDEDAKRLEELKRADWACLWVQVMRSLRQGVRLKKIEHVHQPPLEYELTPFEMILEDIRSRRYTLHKIMVNGEIPHKVKNDAHEVILNFIRSRPPLKKVDERKLKPKPPPSPDPHELLLQDIRAQPKLRPVRGGKLVVETSHEQLVHDNEQDHMIPVKRLIKPDLNLLLNNSFSESSDEEESLAMSTPSLSSSCSSTPSPQKHYGSSDHIPWRRSGNDIAASSSQQRPSKLQRRHTIMVCESPMEGKVAQELPPLAEEEDEPSPIKESHSMALLHSTRLRPNSQSLSHQQIPLSLQSLSDHDIQNQIMLRQPHNTSNLKRRSSMEHRRSLSSLATGLCAIPEMEDNSGGNSNSPDKKSPSGQKPSPLMRRSWSTEQAPPPNPSPPIKARARAGAAFSMGVNGTRITRSHSLSSTSYLHVSSHQNNPNDGSRLGSEMHDHVLESEISHSSFSSYSDLSSISMHTATDENDNDKLNLGGSFQSQSPTKARHRSTASIYMNAPKQSNTHTRSVSTANTHSSSSSSYFSSPSLSPSHQHSSSLSSSNSSNYQTASQNGNANLNIHQTSDLSSMSRPPNTPCAAQRTKGANSIGSLDTSTSLQSPAYRKNDFEQHNVPDHSHTQGQPNRWRHPTALEQRVSRQKLKENEESLSSHQDIPIRRLSLDGGFNRYSDNNTSRRREDVLKTGSSLDTASPSPTSTPIPARRSSLVENRLLEKNSSKTMEEEERVSRWRTLQKEDMENRGSCNNIEETSLALTSVSTTTVMRSPSSGGSDRNRKRVTNDEGSVSFSTRYQQLKQQYQNEQQKSGGNVIDTEIVTSGNNHQQQQQQQCHQQRHNPSQSPSKIQHHKNRISTSGRRLLYESPEALQHQIASDEARLTRWRQLEEGRRASSEMVTPSMNTSTNDGMSEDSKNEEFSLHSYVELNESDLEYVSGSSYLHTGTSPTHVDEHASNTLTNASTNDDNTISHSHLTSQLVARGDCCHTSLKRWENPIECLSLTLEEVTHIRSVLTKAELESLITHPDLYQMVSKSKLCFTCKTTRFTLFGEWGTKCRFCKRTVCSKCLRKMNVPSDQFRNIPVYSLSPTPFSQEVQEFIQNFVRNGPVAASVVTSTNPSNSSSGLKQMQSQTPSISQTTSVKRLSQTESLASITEMASTSNIPPTSNPDTPKTNTATSTHKPNSISPSKPIQRSQSVLVANQKSQTMSLSSSNTRSVTKCPVLPICCDCKGMIMEIIRASKTSLALISTSDASSLKLLPTTGTTAGKPSMQRHTSSNTKSSLSPHSRSFRY